MDNFIYNAPHFFDFSKGVDSEDVTNAEAFFEVEHENHGGSLPGNRISIEESEQNVDLEFFTPQKSPEVVNAEKCLRNRLRKSISMVNLVTDTADSIKVVDDEVDTISTAIENLQVSPTKHNRNTKFIANSSESRRTQKTTPKLNLRSRSISRDNITNISQSKRKVISHEDLHTKKFVSMAEAISQFQQKTPKRFHTKSKLELNQVASTKFKGPIQNTIPHSPALATKARSRPVYALSREEQEMKEYEEFKKFKIKANPVNSKVLNGPVLPIILPEMKKPPTKPEPFNLTQVSVKKAQSSPKKELFEFHAKPVPKSVLEAPKPIIKLNLCTVPHTPKLIKRYQQEKALNKTMADNASDKKGQQPFKLVSTMLVPFSFEERDKNVIKKKEMFLNQVLEEEKKAREFHARPLPKNLFRSPQAKNESVMYQKSQKSNNSIYSTECLNESTIFKARPAKVLQMKPFEPKKEGRILTDISCFQLNTERRAKEREEFEHKKKEKEDKLAQIYKQNQEKQLHLEVEAAAKLRKEMEYKANPIRKYKEVQPIVSKKLTEPISPKFSYNKSHNKENSTNTSTNINF